MRQQNVICFSSGLSLPIVDALVENVNKINSSINIQSWKTFITSSYGESSNNKTDLCSEQAEPRKFHPLFRFLTKNIPSFDFAIIIAGQDDIVYPNPNPNTNQPLSSSRKEMRDNVVFELGMCCMALGESKVILLQQDGVRLLDNLRGENDNEPDLTIDTIQLEAFSYASVKDIPGIAEKISDYINQAAHIYDPVIVGSACATADAYFKNFVKAFNYALNLYQKKDNEKPVKLEFPDHPEYLDFCEKLDNIELHIMMPTENVLKIADFRYVCADKLYKNKEFNIVRECRITDPGRTISFACKKVCNKLFIIDLPTTMLASYDTAQTILGIADNTVEDKRLEQEEMYLAKEIDMFKETLQSLFKKNPIPIKCVVEEISLDDTDRKNIPWLYEQE